MGNRSKTDLRETHRSSSSEVFFKIGALKNFAKFTGKHLCSSLSNKVEKETLLKRESSTVVFL